MVNLRIPRTARGVLSVATAASALLVATGATAATSNPDGSSTVSGSGYSFKNFQLGALPAEYCPDPNSPCQNNAAEPAIRADKFGNFFGSSENGLGGGTEAWKSVDGGLHYVHLPSPNNASTAAAGGVPAFNVSPAGGDTDLATASAKNSFGLYNVYVASLELSNVAVSTSTDGGHTWALNPGAAHFSGDDREWIAADGASKVCISYHDLASAEIHVDCSYGAGAAGTFTQPAVPGAIDAAHAYLSTDFMIGNMAIDQNSNTADPSRKKDIVYQSFSGIGSLSEAACATQGTCGNHVVYMGVSLDGGNTFIDHTVYFNPDPKVSYGHQFVNVSVDQAGNVYAFYSDDHNLYYSYSTDHGTTWSGPFKVNRSPSNTSIMPWSVAGDAGKVDVVWYGTSYYDGVNPPDRYPPSATWHVYFAQNLNALGNPGGWTQVQASPINHFGAVCEGGVGCTGNRDLYDDFGVAARPTTGLASIIYSDDQYDQFNHTLTYPSNCTQAQNNSQLCDHTSIATQLTGPGIFGGGTGGGGTGGGGSGGGGGGTCREGDGGGDMQSAKAGTAHTSFDADNCEDGDTNQVQANDPGAGEDFKSTQVQSVAYDNAAHSITMLGTGLSNGLPVDFQMVAVDNGALPGTVVLSLGNGYTLAGTLINGSVTLN